MVGYFLTQGTRIRQPIFPLSLSLALFGFDSKKINQTFSSLFLNGSYGFGGLEEERKPLDGWKSFYNTKHSHMDLVCVKWLLFFLFSYLM